MRLGVAQSEELELQGNQNQSAVFRDPRVMLAKSREFIEGILVPAKSIRDGLDSLPNPIVEQREKDIFLALKVRIEGAARVTRAGGDILEARGLETVLRENALGGRKQFSPGRFGAFVLA